MDSPNDTYEDAFGGAGKRIRRVMRAVRWRVKRGLGAQVCILVETRWRLGDEVMALPIYEALKKRYPASRLSVWCNHPDLLLDNPHVDAVIPGDAHPQAEGIGPDRYILLRGAPRDVYRIAHYATQADVPTPDTQPALHYADWSSPHRAGGDEPIALCTGASWETKQWPPEQWCALRECLTERGFSVVQVGRDDPIIEGCPNLVGETSVREAACMLRGARLLVCSDSGLMHLALAVGTPVVALFGPTDPTILVRNNPLLHALTNERDCVACWNVSQAMTTPGVCPRDIAPCLETISVDAVMACIEESLHCE